MLIQGGQDAEDVSNCRSISAKEPLITGLFCGTRPVQIRHPRGLRHPVRIVLYTHTYTYLYVHEYIECTYVDALYASRSLLEAWLPIDAYPTSPAPSISIFDFWKNTFKTNRIQEKSQRFWIVSRNDEWFLDEYLAFWFFFFVGRGGIEMKSTAGVPFRGWTDRNMRMHCKQKVHKVYKGRHPHTLATSTYTRNMNIHLQHTHTLTTSTYTHNIHIHSQHPHTLAYLHTHSHTRTRPHIYTHTTTHARTHTPSSTTHTQIYTLKMPPPHPHPMSKSPTHPHPYMHS